MSVSKAFLSLAHLPDAENHHAYNEWHQLDHRPENLALPGVHHGERWVRTPADVDLVDASASSLGDAQYLNMYLFRDPFEPALAEWRSLAERSLYWGRRPDMAVADRTFIGFFTVLQQYVSRRVLVAPEVVPLRPNRGVRLSITKVHDVGAAEAQTLLAWRDRVWIPAALSTPGVAGAWTFVSDPAVQPPVGDVVPAGLLVELLFLDARPEDAVPTVTQLESDLRTTLPADVASAEEEEFQASFRTITPWQWGWFDPTT